MICGETTTTSTGGWVCVRDDHGWHSPNAPHVAATRRRQGKIPGTDRHYFQKRRGPDPLPTDPDQA